MQSIETKYLGPTNNRGARIKASAQAGAVTVSYDHALSVVENHDAAALALAVKLGWRGRWNGGGRANGVGYNFVQAESGGCSFLVPPTKAGAK